VRYFFISFFFLRQKFSFDRTFSNDEQPNRQYRPIINYWSVKNPN